MPVVEKMIKKQSVTVLRLGSVLIYTLESYSTEQISQWSYL